MPRYKGPVVDVDLHHQWRSTDELLAYLPKTWRDYFAGDGRAFIPRIGPPFGTVQALLDGGGMRMDHRPDGLPGSDYELLRTQVLDYHNYYRAVLAFNIGHESGHKNPYLAAALCRAANDWNIERWLPLDDRFYSCVLIPSADPEAAVAEIHRIGDHPRLVEVLLPANPLGRAYGDPVYHPIYAAARQHDLSIAIHLSGEGPDAVGAPGNFVEGALRHAWPAPHHITSFIVNGVFERFPGLKVLVKEFGVAWLPHLIWELDESYDVLRLESPWVKKRPIEYILSNMMFDTQPMELSKESEPKWIELMATIERVDDVLCFASDYPHQSSDDAQAIARMMPDAWAAKIMCENACRFYGWPTPSREATDERVPAAART